MIESYSFGRMKINSVLYKSDLIVFNDHITSDWWRIKSHELHVEDLEEVFKLKPEILVVGTGNFGLMKVMPETKKRLKTEGIETIVEKTKDAYKTYNKLSKSKKVVGAFHLTC